MAGLGGAFQAGANKDWYALPTNYEPYAQDIVQAYGGSNYTPFTQAADEGPVMGPAGQFGGINNLGNYKLGEFDLGGGPGMAAAYNKQFGTGWFDPTVQSRYIGNVGNQYGAGPTTPEEAAQKSAMLSGAASGAIGQQINPELAAGIGRGQSTLATNKAADIENMKFSFKKDILPALAVLGVPAMAAFGGMGLGLGALGGEAGAAGAAGAAGGEAALSAGAGEALGTAGWGVNPATGVGSMANLNAAEGLFNAPISSLGTNQGVQAAMQAGINAGGAAAGAAVPTPATSAPGGGPPMPPAPEVPPTPAAAPAGAAGGAGAGGAAPPAVTGNATIDGILANNWQNLLKLGVSGASLMMAKSKSDQMPESMKQLQGVGQQSTAQGQGLINSAIGGALTAPQQANIDRYTQDSKNQIRQHFASIGQFDSTSRIQAERLIDQQAESMKLQATNQTFDQGARLLGIGQGPLQQAAQYQMGQDKALVDALGQFALGVGGMFGQQAGKGTTTTPTPQQ